MKRGSFAGLIRRPVSQALLFLAFMASSRESGAQSYGLPPLPDQAAAPVAAPKLGGYIQARETVQERVGLTAFLNRARLSADGALPSKFTYRTLIEFEASAGRNAPATVSLREAIIKWTPGALSFTAGQFKTPFSREYLLPVPVLETADFAAVVDSLSPKYDVGIMAEYNPLPLVALQLGLFNGEGQNAIANRDSTVMQVGRAVLRPVSQLALGGSVARDGSDSLRWGLEGNADLLGGMVRAEYITRHVQGRARDRDDSGWYVFEGYRVVPQVQLISRQEEFKRPAYGLSRRVKAFTLGANWEIAPNRVRLLVEGIRRRNGAALTRADLFIGQVQVRF